MRTISPLGRRALRWAQTRPLDDGGRAFAEWEDGVSGSSEVILLPA
jgi:hypothetical protein